MKKIFRNNRLIAIAFLTLFTTRATQAAITDGSNDVPVQLRFIGSINNHSVFQLKVAGNTQQDDFTLTIRDTYGNSIYRENIKANNFSRKFLFDTDELGDETLKLEVYNRSTRQYVVYDINRQYSSMQNVVITEQK